MDKAQGVQRRRLLSRGALLFGSAVGLGLVGRGGVGMGDDPKPGAPGPFTMAVTGRNWQLTYPDRRRGILPQPGERSASFGQLYGGPSATGS